MAYIFVLALIGARADPPSQAAPQAALPAARAAADAEPPPGLQLHSSRTSETFSCASVPVPAPPPCSSSASAPPAASLCACLGSSLRPSAPLCQFLCVCVIRLCPRCGRACGPADVVQGLIGALGITPVDFVLPPIMYLKVCCSARASSVRKLTCSNCTLAACACTPLLGMAPQVFRPSMPVRLWCYFIISVYTIVGLMVRPLFDVLCMSSCLAVLGVLGFKIRGWPQASTAVSNF